MLLQSARNCLYWGGCIAIGYLVCFAFHFTHFMRTATLFKRKHLRATQIATLNFWSQEENQIIGPLEGRKDGRYVSPELSTAGIRNSAWRTIWVKREREPVAILLKIKRFTIKASCAKTLWGHLHKCKTYTKYPKGLFDCKVRGVHFGRRHEDMWLFWQKALLEDSEFNFESWTMIYIHLFSLWVIASSIQVFWIAWEQLWDGRWLWAAHSWEFSWERESFPIAASLSVPKSPPLILLGWQSPIRTGCSPFARCPCYPDHGS